jgi:hypothetical protein
MKRFDENLKKARDGKYILFTDHEEELEKVRKQLRKVIVQHVLQEEQAVDDFRNYILKYRGL